LSLTYPKQQTFDSSKPEKNWFLYWKTSSRLWEAKIQEFPMHEPVLLPLNWDLHSSKDGSFDFGEYKPETNICELIELINKHQRRAIVVIGIGAIPFLPNGGVPHFIPYHNAVDKEGFLYHFVGENNEIYKIPSFFDRRLLAHFGKFVGAFGQILREKKLNCEVIGSEAGTIDRKGFFTSFLQEHSANFQKYFHQYLKTQGANPFDNASEIAKKEEDFRELMIQLYSEVAKDSCGKYWQGVFRFSFLGATFEQNIMRAQTEVTLGEDYINQLLASFSYEVMPSLMLLNASHKQGMLAGLENKYLNDSYFQNFFETTIHDDNESHLKPLQYVEFLGVKESFLGQESFLHTWGLLDYMNKRMPWCYHISESFDVNLEEENDEKVYFLNAARLENISSVFKLFFQGAQIVLGMDELSEENRRKLEVFLLENEIETTQMRNPINLKACQLGEGMMILVESKDIHKLNESQRNELWGRVLSMVNIRHLQFSENEHIQYFWTKRNARENELSYEQVRRVHIINTSMKTQKVKARTLKSFALTKAIDVNDSKMNQDKKEIICEIKPQQSMALEFGLYD
jgi:hypothetical protein